MAVLVKQIKPKRLQEDAMRLALLSAMHAAARVIRQDFAATTANWKHKVKFEHIVSLAQGNIAILVTTDDEIYRYVNEGTKPHEIWAGIYTGKSNKTTLFFPSVFTPKTKPGSLVSGAGRKGKRDTHTPYVEHPGTEARNFDEQIEKKREKWYKQQMEAAMSKARKASGHAI